jgi:hypothetical protein
MGVHRELGDSRHALHRACAGQDVVWADRTVDMAVALEGVALQRRQLRAFPRGDQADPRARAVADQGSVLAGASVDLGDSYDELTSRNALVRGIGPCLALATCPA